MYISIRPKVNLFIFIHNGEVFFNSNLKFFHGVEFFKIL